MQNDIIIQFDRDGQAPRLAFKDEYGKPLFYLNIQRDEHGDFQIEMQDQAEMFLEQTTLFADWLDENIDD